MMANVLAFVCCALLAGISDKSLEVLAESQNHENKINGEHLFIRLEPFPEEPKNVEKRDDSDYSYSSEVHQWNSHEAEVDMNKREALLFGQNAKVESLHIGEKQKVRRSIYANAIPQLEDEDDSSKVREEEDLTQESAPLSFDKKQKFYREMILNTFAEKTSLLDLSDQMVVLLKVITSVNDLSEKRAHLHQRSLNVLNGVKPLIDIVKNIYPLEGALNLEAQTHGDGSYPTNERSPIKANAKNFLPSLDRAARDLFSHEKDKKRSADENDDSLGDLAEATDIITTDTPTETTHKTTRSHHRKGSRKHPKSKGGHPHLKDSSATTTQSKNVTTSAPKETGTTEHKKTVSKSATKVLKTTTKHPKKSSESKAKGHSITPGAVHHAKSNTHFTTTKAPQERATNTASEFVGSTVMAEEVQNLKNPQLPSLIDGSPKYLKSSNQRKGLLSDALENKPSVGKDAGNDESMKDLRVGNMELNITSGDAKDGIKGPMVIDTKVLISGDSKGVFSIGKMKGLLLLGESQDFVSGSDQKSLLEGKPDEQKEEGLEGQKSAVDGEAEKVPSGKSKKLLSGGRQPSGFLGVLTGNLPFPDIKISINGENDSIKNAQQGDKPEKKPLTDKSARKETGISTSSPLKEETQTTVETEKITEADSDASTSKPRKDTSRTSEKEQQQGVAAFDTATSGAALAKDSKNLSKKIGNLLPSKKSEIPLLTKVKSLSMDQSLKTSEDSLSIFKQFDNTNDTSERGKSFDANVYSDQDSDKLLDWNPMEDIQVEEAISDIDDIKGVEVIAPLAAGGKNKTNVESDIGIAASKPKPDDMIPPSLKSKSLSGDLNPPSLKSKSLSDDTIPTSLKSKGEMDEKIQSDQLAQNKKDEDYEVFKPGTDTNGTDDRQAYEEADVNPNDKVISPEVVNLSTEGESIPEGENQDKINFEMKVKGDFPDEGIASDLESKAFAAMGRPKGFIPFGRGNNGMRNSGSNRYLMPQEGYPNGDSQMFGFPSQMDKGFLPQNVGASSDAFGKSLDSLLPEQPMLGFQRYGDKTDDERKNDQQNQQAVRPVDQQNQQAVVGNRDEPKPNDKPEEIAENEKPKNLRPPKEGAAFGFPKSFMGRPENARNQDSHPIPDDSPNSPPEEGKHAGVEKDKNLQEQNAFGGFPFGGQFPNFGSLNAFNPNPRPFYFGGNKAFHDNLRPSNPAFNAFLSDHENPDHKDFMPGFEPGGFN